MRLSELISLSIGSLAANRLRTILTSIGMLVANASLVLVVSISMAGKERILGQIEALGSNSISAYYEVGSHASTVSSADFINSNDVAAVRQNLGSRAMAVTGVMSVSDTITINGQAQDITILGSDEQYMAARNIQLVAGRFLLLEDIVNYQKVALLTEHLANRIYGSPDGAINRSIELRGVPFTIIGVFKEKVETFGLTELNRESVLIPISVLKYFVSVERIDPLYVRATHSGDVESVAAELMGLLGSRHRAGARYRVETLTEILNTARGIAQILTILLLGIAGITLAVSGIGIMNIMLTTVTERTREIGMRMAIGASRKTVLAQFLLEAVLISVAGGISGTVLGMAIPLVIRFVTDGDYNLPLSYAAGFVALVVSVSVGIVFGWVPARRAALLSPMEALRYE
jgi:putative ABC transport system permease protein